MKICSLLCFLLLFFLCLHADPLLDELLKRNGDVYLLISNPAASQGKLFMFDQSDAFRRYDVVPPTSPIATQLHQYVGFAVDKFGHIKLFRARDDLDNATGSTSILSLLTRLYPGETGPVTMGTNTMALPGSTVVDASPVGWRYVISPDGKEGWMKAFRDPSKPLTDMDNTFGTYELEEIPGKVPSGATILPPYMKSMPFDYMLTYHGGFWRGGRQTYRVASTVTPAGWARTSSSDWGDSGNAFTNSTGWYDIPYGVSEEIWGIGPTAGVPLSPPIGAFFMIPHYNGSWTGNFGTYRAAAKISDAKKNVKLLMVNTFLSKVDNDVMRTNAAASTIFNTLQNGRDFFTTGLDPSGSYSDITDNPLASTVSFSVDIGRWNHCGDLCGLGANPSNASPPPPPSSRAYASSYGKDQSEQKLYMIKRASMGGSDVLTSVIEIRVQPGGNQQATLVNSGNTYPALHGITNWPIDGYVVGDADVNYSNADRQVVYRVFASDLGIGGTYPDYAQSLGFSKRRDGRSDYVYYSNLPPSHFTVSSNFWGTGGTIWYAEESGTNLLLHFRNYNHTTSAAVSSGTINGGDRLPLKAIAADGDNNVYVVHAKNSVEGALQIRRLFGERIDKDSIRDLCINGVITNCTALNIVAGMPACPNGTPLDPFPVNLQVKQHAGFSVEKLSPLVGSVPEKVGMVPNVQVGTCSTTVYFPLSPSEKGSCRFIGDRAAAYTDPWVCTAAPGTLNLNNINVDLAVINVPNPPASGSSMQISIVDPCLATVAQACDMVTKTMYEDTNYTFRMENPPHFAGMPAILSQSSNPILQGFGTVNMISNYQESGWNYTKTLALTAPPLSGIVEDYFMDSNDHHGALGASFLNQPYPASANALMNPLKDINTVATRTMRYRWIVRSKTPPHSLIKYTSSAGNKLPFKPDGSDYIKENCASLRATSLTPLYLNPLLENPVAEAQMGLLYDSCWQDMDREIATDTAGKVYAPADLSYKFVDPGLYNVTLMVGALGFDLSGITYLSDPSSVGATMVVTWHTMPVMIGAKPPTSNPFVTNVKISATDLKSGSQNIDVAVEMSQAEFTSAFSASAQDATTLGRLMGPLGSMPLYPTHYYSGVAPLVVTHQDQLTPLYAEAKLHFFGSLKTEYINSLNTGVQSKFSGLGSYDFLYECSGSSLSGGVNASMSGNCGSIGGVALVDKKNTHPSNWGAESASTITITSLYGNDGSSDPSSKRSARVVNNAGAVFSSSNFDVLHQGTLARNDYYPDGGDLITSPYSFYTWYDIKYAWFIRYQKPSKDPSSSSPEVVKRILRTGNLSEIFLMNYYANHYNGGNPQWQKLLKILAPKSLEGQGMNLNAGHLIEQESAGNTLGRTLVIRIPLFNSGAILNGSGDTEQDAPLYSTFNEDAEFTAPTFSQLLKRIHPLKFPIPTGVTVLEIGFQLFAPVVTWKGQEPILLPNGTESGQFNYYDVWPAVVSPSGVSPTNNISDLFATYPFGSESFSSWKFFGTPHKTYAATPLDIAGLQLGGAPGGFVVGSDGIASFAGVDDHFIDIFVSDLENPSLSLLSGGNQTLEAGRANLIPMRIRIHDNNPYGNWLDYNPDLVTFSGIHDGVPALSNFYYAFGHDPRNRRGLGLFEQKSYSFSVSDREINNLDNNAAFNPFMDEGVIYPAREGSAKKQALDTLGNDFSSFYYPFDGVVSGAITRPNDRLLLSSDWAGPVGDWTSPRYARYYADSLGGTEVAYWNHPISQDTIFVSTGSVRPVWLDVQNSVNQPMQYHLLSAHYPNDNYFKFPDEADEINRVKIHLVAHGDLSSCLDTAMPHEENPANCGIWTEWEVPKSAIIAPFFFNNDYGIELGVFAVGQDARIYSDYRKSSSWFTGTPAVPAMNSYYYRLTGKSYAPVNRAYVNGASSIGEMRDRAQEGAYYAQAQQITSISVTDTTSPNLRVSFLDFKTRIPQYYSITMNQGMQKNPANNELSWSNRVNLFRSADLRGSVNTAGYFTASGFEKLKQSIKPDNHYRISEFSTTATENEFFWQVPEDTRFQIHATMSDNATGQILEGSLSIQSGSCNGTNINIGSYSMPFAQSPYRLLSPSVKTPPNQYLDLADYRINHLYPRHGEIDEIRVEAVDHAGNRTVICVPVQVVRQDVHYRLIGNESERR